MGTDALSKGFEAVGFDKERDTCLFLCGSKHTVENLHVRFHLEKADTFGATGVFFKKEREDYYNPQIYLYDRTGELFDENTLTTLQKRVWSSGIVPLVCVFYDTEIKIIDCTTHTKGDRPVFLSTISLIDKARNAYNELFAVKIKTGVFWEEEENKERFCKKDSSYNVLINWIQALREEYTKMLEGEELGIINKVIIQAILIKYLEERKDKAGKNLFQDKYFKEYNNATTFVEVLNDNNDFISLLHKLQKDFNGNVFEWTEEESELLKKIDLSLLSKALKGYSSPNDGKQGTLELIRYYEFGVVPVELISRLYEEFLGEDKRSEGIYYTPPHLARLLVDESMPLSKYNQVDLSTYRILDPACGSGIFLVFAFKRLVQWWRLQQEDFNTKPSLNDLKGLLSCIYGVDKEKQATTLTAFSLCLALCDELSPLQIITQLRFDNLTRSNILRTDFFIDELTSSPQGKRSQLDMEEQKENYDKLRGIGFDLVVGNPPFGRRGKLKGVNNNFWQVDIGGDSIGIPSKQLALKFLVRSFDFLREGGLQCLIVKSASFLYNTTAFDFKKSWFSQYHVEKIFDFTPLARNRVLWDNADIDTLAIVTRKESPDNSKNILHLTFRRTKSIKDRLSFDIDDYDRHFVNRRDAMREPYIWKTNLLGGGRIRTIVERLRELETLKETFSDKVSFTEGAGSTKNLPNKCFRETYIEKEFFPEGYIGYFKNIDCKKFQAPNILVKENIVLPFARNEENIPYSNDVVGICPKEKGCDALSDICDYLGTNREILQFYMIAAFGRALVSKNTVIKKEDIEALPYYKGNIAELLSPSDMKVISDVLKYYQFFFRTKDSDAVQPIPLSQDTGQAVLRNYGSEFCLTLNSIYEQDNQRFRLSEITSLFGNTYIAVTFKYDNLPLHAPCYSRNAEDIVNLSDHQVSSSLSTTRIVKMYGENSIVFIKPNQYRYWLAHIAYRDADKCMVDLLKAGY
jgi:hypothetical protein